MVNFVKQPFEKAELPPKHGKIEACKKHSRLRLMFSTSNVVFKLANIGCVRLSTKCRMWTRTWESGSTNHLVLLLSCRGERAWLGLTDTEEEGTFVWLDGTNGKFTSTYRHLPQYGNVDMSVDVDIESHPVGSFTPTNVQFQSKIFFSISEIIFVFFSCFSNNWI